MSAPAPSLPSPGARRGWPWVASSPAVARVPRPPRITLVTPSFNQGGTIEATIRSVLLQEYPNLEYVVLDGGSTDGAVEVIRRYAPWLTRWASAPDRGQSDAVNAGLRDASGEILGWLNSDDRLLPGALWRVAAAHAAEPAAAAWVGACRSVDPGGREIYTNAPRALARDALADWGHAGQFGQPACFFSRAAWLRAGSADEALHYAFDVDLWLRLAAHGPFVAVDAVLAEETIHPAAKTFAQRGRSLAELHLVQLRHGYAELAFRRMAEELQEREVLRRGTAVERLRYQVNLAVRPYLTRLRALVERRFRE